MLPIEYRTPKPVKFRKNRQIPPRMEQRKPKPQQPMNPYNRCLYDNEKYFPRLNPSSESASANGFRADREPRIPWLSLEEAEEENMLVIVSIVTDTEVRIIWKQLIDSIII